MKQFSDPHLAALLTRRQMLVELAYFWSYTATLQATLTPDLGQNFPSVFCFTYFTYHVGAIVAASFLVFGCRCICGISRCTTRCSA